MVKVKLCGELVGRAKTLHAAQDLAHEIICKGWEEGVFSQGDEVPVKYSERGRVLFEGVIEITDVAPLK